MKKYLSIVTVLAIALPVIAQKQTWTLDKDHAKLGFTVTHLKVSEVEGLFKDFDIKLTASDDAFSDAVIELTARANTIDTDNQKRDEHLRSADFFDVEKYPTFSFKSKSFDKVGDKKYKLTGYLTMHGVSKLVELDVIFNGTIEHPYSKKTIAGFKVNGKLNRSDFNIGGSMPDAVVSNDIRIVANAEFAKD